MPNPNFKKGMKFGLRPLGVKNGEKTKRKFNHPNNNDHSQQLKVSKQA